MITKEQNINKYCCLYVSDFHLEMILLPFIKNKMKSSEILIFTQKDLSESINILIEKINLSTECKKDILNIKNWNNTKLNECNNQKIKEYTIIINGDDQYRNSINQEIKKIKTNQICIVDCYNINDIEIKKYEIKEKYRAILNTESI